MPRDEAVGGDGPVGLSMRAKVAAGIFVAVRAFAEAGVEDEELIVAVREQTKILSSADSTIEALELARDCCESLAGDFELEARS